MDNFSLSDIKSVLDNNDNGFIWILLLFIIWFGAGGFGGNGNGTGTQAEIQRGFDQQTTTSKLDQLAYGLSNSGYENAQLSFNTNNNLTQGFMGLAREIANIAQQNASCCCGLSQEIMTNRYDAQANTCSIQQAIHAEGENTRALIRSNREKDLENENGYLRMQNLMCGVVRYPNSSTYSAGPWPLAGCSGTSF